MRTRCGTPSRSSTSAAWRMVAQSDWLPITTATRGWSIGELRLPAPVEARQRRDRVRQCCRGLGRGLVLAPDLDEDLLAQHARLGREGQAELHRLALDLDDPDLDRVVDDDGLADASGQIQHHAAPGRRPAEPGATVSLLLTIPRLACNCRRWSPARAGNVPTRGLLFDLLSTRQHWLAQREAVLTRNVANADTPSFRPLDLRPRSFAKALARQVDPQAAVGLAVTQPGHMASPA